MFSDGLIQSHSPMTALSEQEQGSQDRTAETGQEGRDSQVKTARKAARTGQPGQGSQNSAAITGQP
jgi:hypothetical protein